MDDYNLDDLLIKEGDSHLQNNLELHYPSYENFTKIFIKNYKNTARNYIIELGALAGFSLVFYLILTNLKNIWESLGSTATFSALFAGAIFIFICLDLFVKHYLYKFNTAEINEAMRMIFKILDENNIVLTEDLVGDLIDKFNQKRSFRELVQATVIASGIFGIIMSVIDYFTNLRDPNVELNAGLYIEVIALSLFTLGSAVAILISIYALVTDMRKRILFNEVIEAINLNKHVKKIAG